MILREDLRRWFKEKWVDISKKTKGGKHPPCGRSKAKDSKYPKCRPSVRVSSETPETSGEMSKSEKKKAVRQKRSAEAKVSTTGKGRKPVMTSHLKEDCGCEASEKTKKVMKFMKKKLKEHSEVHTNYACNMNKLRLESIENSCLNKKSLVIYMNENNETKYAKGFMRIASNSSLREGYDFEVVNGQNITPINSDNILSLKYFDNNELKEYSVLNEGKNKPTNPKLWARAKALAKSKFKVYPSAYANGWASKWYKKHGGGWRSVNESVELQESNLSKKQKEKMKSAVSSFKSNNLVIAEEIVNAKHAGTMTKKEIKSRDKTAKKVKAKPIKPGDTEENARYRLATFIELRKRGAEPKGKKPKKGKKK